MSKGIIIIGGCRTNRTEIINAASRAMKTDIAVNSVIHHLVGCTNIRFEEVEEFEGLSKRIKETFAYSGIVAENLKDSFEKLIEEMKNFKPKQSLDPQPSKYLSKPKNNFKVR